MNRLTAYESGPAVAHAPRSPTDHVRGARPESSLVQNWTFLPLTWFHVLEQVYSQGEEVLLLLLAEPKVPESMRLG